MASLSPARRGLSRSLGKLLLLGLSSLSAASPLPALTPFIALHSSHSDEGPRTPLQLFVDVASIIALVLLGGVFAGLTLGLMGLDMVNLQVLSTSGSETEKKHAGKVLRLLEKGRHWVLVVLLLGNVVGESWREA
jgi:metal transporter CNNM